MKGRVVGVDAARGIALLGMMAVNALWAVDAEGRVTWTYAVAAGRSAAVFAVLAGVSIAFMTGRRRARGDDAPAVFAVLTSRAVLIGALGLALGYADPGVTLVILAYYGALFLLAIPFTFLGTRTLLVAGLTIALIVPVVSQALRPYLHEPSGHNPSFGYLFHDPLGLVTELTLTGVYPALPWLAYVCVGMAFGRLQLSSPRVAATLLGSGAAAALAAPGLSWLLLVPLGGEEHLHATAAAAGMSTAEVAELLVWGSSGTTPSATWWWLATDAPHTSTPLDLIHTTGVAVALIGAMLLIFQVGGARTSTVLRPLTAAGSMTLTLYTAHVVFMNSPLDVFPAVTGYLLQVAVGLSLAVLLLRVRSRGPLEAVLAHAARGAKHLMVPPPPVVVPHRL